MVVAMGLTALAISHAQQMSIGNWVGSAQGLVEPALSEQPTPSVVKASLPAGSNGSPTFNSLRKAYEDGQLTQRQLLATITALGVNISGLRRTMPQVPRKMQMIESEFMIWPALQNETKCAHARNEYTWTSRCDHSWN